MSTITKILGYKPILPYNVNLLRETKLFNGTGNESFNFDDIIDLVFDKVVKAKKYKSEKAFKLRHDIEQLVIRHDIDTAFKIGFLRSNRRLAWGLYRLLHKLNWKQRFLASFTVFYAVHCTDEAKENYKLIK